MKTPGESHPDWLDEAVELMAESGRDGVVAVVGGSMAPTLIEGQRIAIEFGPPALRSGDIILYRRRIGTGTRREVHRLLSRARGSDGPPTLRTRGDGNPYLDPALTSATIRQRQESVRS